MKITIVGIGMGNAGTLTLGGKEAIENANLLVGAKRLIEIFPEKMSEPEIYSDKIFEIIKKNNELDNIVVIMSGDTGFYSGATKLLGLLKDYDVKVIPGISSMQYMASKIGRPWQDAKLVSAHGVECNILAEIMKTKETFFLTGGSVTPTDIIDELNEFGLKDAYVYVGERLSYEDEKIFKGTPQELKVMTFASLSVVWVIRKDFSKEHKYRGGISDEAFIRGKVPMTKQEIRSSIIAALKVNDDDVIYDIGAGTGSVGIEIATMNTSTKVYAIETNPEGIELIDKNREKFSAYNLKIVGGKAPLAMENLPAPDRAFIGGSKGNLKEIVELLRTKNPDVKIVLSAIALETLNEAMEVLEDIDITSISIAKAKEIGKYHMMTGQNPIYIISTRG
ncbi:MAG: precorrin-6y C5,15-methyltransferase (decarboxylating) subunit CbiE [Clostridiales bacterium]|nr:precorrin-6y C5,15-methyltransferase (decarboxylating) subunit CbiE [Clostridiales bacterium]